jgi:hypothetical protein
MRLGEGEVRADQAEIERQLNARATIPDFINDGTICIGERTHARTIAVPALRLLQRQWPQVRAVELHHIEGPHAQGLVGVPARVESSEVGCTVLVLANPNVSSYASHPSQVRGRYAEQDFV